MTALRHYAVIPQEKQNMTDQISAAMVEQLIAHDIAACQNLLALLEQEQEALKNRDAEKLGEIVEGKLSPLKTLEESAKKRTQWTQAASLQEASKSWDKMLDDLKNSKLKENWTLLKTLTEECRVKNEINGKILVRNQQVYGRLVDLVRGQTAAPNLYNAVGESTNRHYSNKVGEA